MTTFATDSCNNLFQFVDTVSLHGFSGGTRRDTGCLFLPLYPYQYPIFFTTKSIVKMKQNKKTVPAELSYYGLYLLDYLRKYHPDKASDTGFIAGREEAATATFEKERLAGTTVEDAHEEAMRVLLEGLHFSPYALLTEVVEREFADEVEEQEREPFCRRLYPHLNNLFASYDTSDDTFALSPAHDLLYTELVGTVMLYLESYGVQ